MAFTTQTFTFVFFPICIFAYYLCSLMQRKTFLSKVFRKYRICDLALIGISSCFYLWACFDDIFRFAFYIIAIYLLGKLLETIKNKNYFFVAECKDETKKSKYFSVALPVFFVAVFCIVGILVHFKYTSIVTRVWNFLFKDTVSPKSYMAPLGISFITFSAISYIADIYLGKAGAGTIIDCALYLSFFPKVVSGPIVLWREFCTQIADRNISLDKLSFGASRIMIGFAKKLILADTFGQCIASARGAIDMPTAWGVALLYMLQIYYDFSGYSDIAIGLANMLGFSFKENFNFPYLSTSITEFWRRWHISLGAWFREYIYYPLGGSRCSKRRTVFNIAVVFILTGIWHGAGWTYMLWGIINGLCNIIEKIISEKTWYIKTPKALKWLFTMSVTFCCWVLFRFNDISSCAHWIKVMLGIVKPDNIPYTWQYYFDLRMIVFVIIAFAGATLFGLPKIQKAYTLFKQKPLGYAINQLIIILLFAISILFMVNSTYSPFIYFQY